MAADPPISAAAYGLAWQYGTPAVIWVMVLGTLWWYLLSRGAEILVNKFRYRGLTQFQIDRWSEIVNALIRG